MGSPALVSEASAPVAEMDDATIARIQSRVRSLNDEDFARLANELTVAFRFEQHASALISHAKRMIRAPIGVVGLLRESALRDKRAASIWWSPLYQVMLTEIARRWDIRPEQYGAFLYLALDPMVAREQIERLLPTLVLEALPQVGALVHGVERVPGAREQLERERGIAQVFVGKHDFAAAFDEFMGKLG